MRLQLRTLLMSLPLWGILFAPMPALCQYTGTFQGAVNGVLNASACIPTATAPSWCAGSDIGGYINAAIAALPVTTSGQHIGVVTLTTATYYMPTPVTVSSPWVTIDLNHSTVYLTGGSYAFFFQDPTASYAGNGGLLNGELLGSSATSATGVIVEDLTNFRMENVNISNFTSGVGLQFTNVSSHTEKWYLTHDYFLGNQTGVQFSCSSTCEASYAYGHMSHVTLSVPASGTGMLLDDNSSINGIFADIACFMGQSSTCIHMKSTSQNIFAPYFSVTGELTTGATAAKGIVTDSGTQWQTTWSESYHSGGITDQFLGNLIPVIAANPGSAQLFYSQNGLKVGNTSNTYNAEIDMSQQTNYDSFQFPDVSSYPSHQGFPVVANTYRLVPQMTGFSGLLTASGSCPGGVSSVYHGTAASAGYGGSTRWINCAASTDNKIWDVRTDSDGTWRLMLQNDALTASDTVLSVPRSGTTAGTGTWKGTFGADVITSGNGYTGTATIGSCHLTISAGIITGTSGC